MTLAFQTRFKGNNCQIIRSGVVFMEIQREDVIPLKEWQSSCEQLRHAFDMAYRECWLDLRAVVKKESSAGCNSCLFKIGKSLKLIQP